MTELTWTILAASVATYITRVGGYLVLSNMRRIPPRLESALSAVPAAVLTTLVVPAAFSQGPAEAVVIIAAAIAAFFLPGLAVLAIGWALIVGLRALMG